MKTELAQTLIDAISAKDAEATADAFDALYAHCAMGDDEEAEGESESDAGKSALVIALGKKGK